MTTASEQMCLAVHFPDANGGTDRRGPGAPDRNEFSALERLARTAERGLFDFLLLPGTSRPPAYAGARGPGSGTGYPDPLTALGALAAVTDRIGLAATAGTAPGEPYLLARRLATLDHLSAGRAGWHAAGEPGGGDQEDARAEEFLTAVRTLWDSWAPDGTPRPFAHRGRHFVSEGEFTVPRCPQGRPVVIRTGDAPRDRAAAAASADVLVVPLGTPARGRALRADLDGRLAAHGRRPDELKILPGIGVVLGDSDAEARRRAAGIRPQRSTDRQPFVGSPRTVAAGLAEYVAEGAADGFLLVPRLTPGGLGAFVDRVVPLLQEQGVFRTAYTGSTLRSHLGLDEPVWKG
ncbi:LLM class flavin-dependent oxidoreductase [Streptomyces sp. NPDC057682]|uniref:LLM class flavin-dependent oxidoreductase n=1 Tax=unclassified Streptomyces TaxID=2593676 RepID=UPI003654499E